MRRLSFVPIGLLLLFAIACSDKVTLKLKVGVKDAGPTQTATTTRAVP